MFKSLQPYQTHSYSILNTLWNVSFVHQSRPYSPLMRLPLMFYYFMNQYSSVVVVVVVSHNKVYAFELNKSIDLWQIFLSFILWKSRPHFQVVVDCLFLHWPPFLITRIFTIYSWMNFTFLEKPKKNTHTYTSVDSAQLSVFLCFSILCALCWMNN